MKGTACIRKTANDAQLQYPERVTSTKLRKYLATVSQVFYIVWRVVVLKLTKKMTQPIVCQ